MEPLKFDPLKKEQLELTVQETELATKEFLDTYPKPKRILVIVLAILIIPIFFIAKYTTAALYVHNVNKDHGVIVHTSEELTSAALPVKIVGQPVLLPILGKSYTAFAQIHNQNKSLVAANLNYQFHFYNASGTEIFATGDGISGDTYLLAGGDNYLLAPNIKFSDTPTKISVDITGQTFAKRFDVPNVTIATGAPVYADTTSPTGFAINGTFQNNSQYAFKSLRLFGLVYDKSNQLIAATQTTANAIVPNDQRGYQMSWPLPLGSLVGRVVVIPETDILDPANIQ